MAAAVSELDGRVIHLFEGVGLCLGGEDGQDLDVPVVVVLNGLPESERSPDLFHHIRHHDLRFQD